LRFASREKGGNCRKGTRRMKSSGEEAKGGGGKGRHWYYERGEVGRNGALNRPESRKKGEQSDPRPRSEKAEGKEADADPLSKGGGEKKRGPSGTKSSGHRRHFVKKK